MGIRYRFATRHGHVRCAPLILGIRPINIRTLAVAGKYHGDDSFTYNAATAVRLPDLQVLRAGGGMLKNKKPGCGASIGGRLTPGKPEDTATAP